MVPNDRVQRFIRIRRLAPDITSTWQPRKYVQMTGTAILVALHIFGAVVWVGGMFAIYVCLRPALGIIDPMPRLRLMRALLGNFFPWVWIAVLLLLISGYSMVFVAYGGFAALPLPVNLMQVIGLVMVALFLWLFHGPWLAFKRAVDSENWPDAAASLDRIRQIIAVNLPLGLVVIVTGASGRFWS
jgi:uncharacterized membrane protein